MAGETELMLMLNSGAASERQHLPPGQWRTMLDTARPGAMEESVTGALDVAGHSLVLLERATTSKFRAP